MADVGGGELPALEEQWFAADRGRRVAEDVAEVQRGRMPALAKPPPSGRGDLGLSFANADHLRFKFGEQGGQIGGCLSPLSGLGDDQCLSEGGGC